MKNLARATAIVLSFAIIGSIVGSLPRIYYKYLDDREYIKIVQPIITDKNEYKRGETITLTSKVASEVDVDAQMRYDLIKLDGTVQENYAVRYQEFDISIAKISTSKNITAKRIIPVKESDPCVEDGLYLLRLTVYYQIRDRMRQQSFITSSFKVEGGIECNTNETEKNRSSHIPLYPVLVVEK